MGHVMALFCPITYTPSAESKFQRSDEAPHLMYDFLAGCVGPSVLLDNKIMDVQGSGVAVSGSKNNADQSNENVEKCVKMAEKDTSLEQDAWGNELQIQFESDLRLKTYNYFMDYELSSDGVLAPLYVPDFC